MTTEAEFNRLSIAVRDFEKAIAYLKEAALQPYGCLAHEALIFAAIVCYFRPFSQNEKDKSSPASSKLDIENFSLITEGELQLHEKCKELRNQALAHSEHRYNPTRLDQSVGVIASRPFSLLSHALDINALVALAEKIANECHHKRGDYVRSRRR